MGLKVARLVWMVVLAVGLAYLGHSGWLYYDMLTESPIQIPVREEFPHSWSLEGAGLPEDYKFNQTQEPKGGGKPSNTKIQGKCPVYLKDAVEGVAKAMIEGAKLNQKLLTER